jgi:hypothetical protein
MAAPNWEMELRLRHQRNVMIKAQLQAGRSVLYRSSGWSLYPRVWSNDQTTYEPVISDNMVQVDDIVFCEVQPGNRFYAHLVLRKEWSRARLAGMSASLAECVMGGEWKFTIGNISGRENGWCRIEHIYGRLAECVH